MSTRKIDQSAVVSEIITTIEAANLIGVNESRVRQFLKQGRFGTKKGGRWLIFREEVEKFKSLERPPHRPLQN